MKYLYALAVVIAGLFLWQLLKEPPKKEVVESCCISGSSEIKIPENMPEGTYNFQVTFTRPAGE